MMPIYITTLDDLAWLALAVFCCGIMVAAFWLTSEWLDEMIEDAREEFRNDRRDY
jgi:hypothetical protein